MGNLLKTGKEIKKLFISDVIKNTKDWKLINSKADIHEYNELMYNYFSAVYSAMRKKRCNIDFGGGIIFSVAFETQKPKKCVKKEEDTVVEKNIKNNLT